MLTTSRNRLFCQTKIRFAVVLKLNKSKRVTECFWTVKLQEKQYCRRHVLTLKWRQILLLPFIVTVTIHYYLLQKVFRAAVILQNICERVLLVFLTRQNLTSNSNANINIFIKALFMIDNILFWAIKAFQPLIILTSSIFFVDIFLVRLQLTNYFGRKSVLFASKMCNDVRLVCFASLRFSAVFILGFILVVKIYARKFVGVLFKI